MIKPHHRFLVTSRRPCDELGAERPGLAATDVIVLLALLGLAVLVILMLLPRGRETARMASCQNNLSHVGRSLALYDHLEHKLPSVPELEAIGQARTSQPMSPLRTLLEALVQPNLLGVDDGKVPPPSRPGEVPGEKPVLGFVCSSDPNATSGQFRAPISYRACTGDAPSGENGAFLPGGVIGMQAIQDRDGLSFTAAFSERLVGDNLTNHPAACNYTIPPGPLPAAACPPSAGLSAWRGDAGSSWMLPDYRSTLYNHALPPGSRSSCIESTGGRAFMGASSGHVQGVNLLYLDGRVSVVRPSIDLKIWKEFARIGTLEADSSGR